MIKLEPTLTFIRFTGDHSRDKHRLAEYSCSCGAKTIKIFSLVKSGATKTCGANIHKKGLNCIHGMTKTPEYRIWASLKRRVLDKKDKDYKKYSKLGISESIKNDFMKFYNEVGPRPSSRHSVDRKDNTIGYYEGNLRWATQKEQARNTKKSYCIFIGDKLFRSLSDAADYCNVSICTIVRWCDGFTDPRRLNHKNGGYFPPKRGCRRELYY